MNSAKSSNNLACDAQLTTFYAASFKKFPISSIARSFSIVNYMLRYKRCKPLYNTQKSSIYSLQVDCTDIYVRILQNPSDREAVHQI